MKLKKTRTEIAFELNQIMIVKRRQGSVSGWCSGCELEVVMLTPDEAASITSATTRALYRLIDAGRIHYTETHSGLVRVCLPSLRQVIDAGTQHQGDSRLKGLAVENLGAGLIDKKIAETNCIERESGDEEA